MANKYNYLRVIQQNHGSYGWEDVSEYDLKISTVKERRSDLKEYRLTGYPTRIISRREENV